LLISDKQAPQMAGAGVTPAALDAAACTEAEISNVSYRPNFLSFHYVASTPGWLLVTDRWAAGWKASVNGAPQPVAGGDFIFRAVKVQTGANYIEFKYRPTGFFVLLALSWSTLLLIVGVEIWRRTNRRSSATVRPDELLAHQTA